MRVCAACLRGEQPPRALPGRQYAHRYWRCGLVRATRCPRAAVARDNAAERLPILPFDVRSGEGKYNGVLRRCTARQSCKSAAAQLLVLRGVSFDIGAGCAQDILNIDLQCEFFGILVAPFLLAGYKLTLIAAEEGNAPEQDLTTGSILQSQLMSAILQVSIELIVDLTPALLVVALHKRHSTAGLEDIGPPIPRDADVDSVEAVDSAEVQDELAGVKAKPGGRDLESGGSFIVGVSPKRHPICPVNGEALVAPVIAVDPGTPKPGDAERSPVGSSSWDGSGPDSPVQAINQATDLDNMRQNSAGELIHALVTSSDHAGAGRGHVTDDSDARSGEGFEGKTGSPSPARVPGRIQSPQPHRSRTRRKRRGSVARGGRSRTRRGSFLESMFVGASELQPLSMDSTGNFDDKDLGLHPDASTAPESLWQELSHIRVITTLKANVVCSLNCWDQRFDHYFLVVMAFVVGWSTYFLRSFFYVGSVMCSQRDDHGDWEWFVCGTH